MTEIKKDRNQVASGKTETASVMSLVYIGVIPKDVRTDVFGD